MIDLSKLHFKPTSSRGFKPAPSLQQIHELEQYYQHTLPESYKNMLVSYNGNYPQATYFDQVDSESNLLRQFELEKFFFLDADKDSEDNVWKMIRIYTKHIGPGSIPIADDGLGQIYFLKWHDNSTQVWYTDYLDNDDPKNILAKDSFDELLESLYEEN